MDATEAVAGLLGTDLDEAFFAPQCTPGVLDKVVIVTVLSAVADGEDNVIQIDSDATHLGRRAPVGLGLVGDIAATLLSAIPLASPYLWHYESAFLAPAALFLLRDGVITPARPLTLLLGLAMWLSLGPSALALLQTGQADLFRPVFLPIALAAFLTCLWHTLLRPRPSANPAASEQPQ